jgi:hypothetical protein
LHVSGNVGISSLIYNIDGGYGKPKLSYGGKFGYIYYFSPYWGFGAGFEVAMYNTDGYLNGAKTFFENQVDNEGHLHRKEVYFRDWHELQTVLFAEVPVMIQYQYDFGMNKRRKIYINMGAKFQLPLMANYSANGELETQGYYYNFNCTLSTIPGYSDLSDRGFGTVQKSASGSMNLPFNVCASLGIGFAFEVSPMIDIFLGGTFDYGFLNLKAGNDGDLLYGDQNNLQYRGILFSSVAEKINTVSAKGEIGMRFAIGKPITQKKPHKTKKR